MLGRQPARRTHTQCPDKKHINIAQNMLCMAWMVIVRGCDIKKTTFRNYTF